MKNSNSVLIIIFGTTAFLSAFIEESEATPLNLPAATCSQIMIANHKDVKDKDVKDKDKDKDVAPDNRKKASSNRRSPQGIDEDYATRRANSLDRSGKKKIRRTKLRGREIRTIDGTSNNLKNPTWGSTFSQLQRLAPANYTDGISSMAGGTQKSAREISNLIVSQAEGEDIPNIYGTSDYLWLWGQFIDHDIGLTDGSTASQEYIIVPTGDVFFDPNGTGTAVIPFNRAIYDPDTGVAWDNVREQENEVSSWIDGSMIYGSDEERNSILRVGPQSPMLATSENNLLPFNLAALHNANGFVSDPTSLFIAGDVRVNEQASLTAMHTIWVREHNRIAKKLQLKRPEASIEQIYQTARRLVIAEIQIITYNEFIPALLGSKTMPSYAGYDAKINPTIYNEFSAAAYRLGHSGVSDRILRIDADGNRAEGGNLPLRSAFFSGVDLFKQEDDIDSILRGLAKQSHQAIDTQVVNGLRNFLFGKPGYGGFDLTSLNIQRGRDHGLSSYNDTRQAMGLSEIQSFSDITDNTKLQTNLFNAYGSVDDIDLWTGGLAEDPLIDQGSQLGELFTAIIVKQFNALRAGDRFWYSRYLKKKELKMVKKVTLSQVIRNNTSIGNELQKNVFFVE